MKKTFKKALTLFLYAAMINIISCAIISCAVTADPRLDNPSAITLVNNDRGTDYGFEITQLYRFFREGEDREVGWVLHVEYEGDPRMQGRHDAEMKKRLEGAWEDGEHSHKGVLANTFSALFRNDYEITIVYWDMKNPERLTQVTVPPLRFTNVTLTIENGKASVTDAARVMTGRPAAIAIVQAEKEPVPRDSWRWTSGGSFSRTAEPNAVKFGSWGATATPGNDAALEKLRTCSAISFKVIGNGTSWVSLITSGTTDGSHYEMTFTAEGTERFYIFKISDFAQPRGSSQAALDQSNIQGLRFMTEGHPIYGLGSLTIRDLTLIQ